MPLNRGASTRGSVSDTIRIRRAAPRDMIGAFEIGRRGFDEARRNPEFGDYVKKKRMTLREQRKWFSNIRRLMQRGKAVFMVADSGGEVVGYCYVEPLKGPDMETSHVGVLGIRVKKEHRGKGIGMRLMTEAIRRCGKVFEVLTLDTMASNDVAAALYRKLGFRDWGRAPRFVKRNGKYTDLRYMYLRLR